ncbi:MAG: GerMN domain-containing protein [Lachnospiraceae bacterium]|nr:GerMN domain-containing protein [Lachnospiraceae bacterium]
MNKTRNIARNRRFGLIMLLLITVFSLMSCGRQQEVKNGKAYLVYYVNKEETKIFANEYQTETEEKQELVDELLMQLSTDSEKMEYIAPLSGKFEVLGYTLDGEQLTIDFDEHYKELDSIKEILTRAAIVRTLTQVEGIKYVSFTIQGEILTDNAGVAIGTMSADMFIDNAGKEINTYEKVNLCLYFANENGDRLVQETQRNVVYNSNISIEKLVVEKLIEGPATDSAYPTINPATKIISVNVKDGICYVNLDSAFLSQPYNVTSDVTMYSITNSLVELPNVNKVQISINGETAILYKESVSLTTIFERNLDIMSTTESTEE